MAQGHGAKKEEMRLANYLVTLSLNVCDVTTPEQAANRFRIWLDSTASGERAVVNVREVDAALLASLRTQIEKGLSQNVASGFIKVIESHPLKEGYVDDRVSVPGLYLHPETGEDVLVVIGKKGYPYALTKDGRGDFRVYVPGLLGELKADTLQDADEAQALSR